MPAPEFFRESFVGQLIYLASGRKHLRYPEEKPGFIIPNRHQPRTTRPSSPSGISDSVTLDGRDKRDSTYKPPEKEAEAHVQATPEEAHSPQQESSVGREYLHHSEDLEKAALARAAEAAQLSPDPNLVEWYSPDDPCSPLNWSSRKKAYITAQISLLTIAMYMGSSIFGPGIADVSQKFGISQVAASLGITMFVAGYAVGPMLLSPISEVPQIGRASIYIITTTIFVIIQVPTALAKNLGALLPLRFLAGFMGSPPLATGAASLADMFLPEDCAAVIGLWSIAGMGGPALGPAIGGFAAQAKGWTWTIWILLWLSGSALLILAFTMPETSAQAILYRRAARLRRLTGNNNLRSQGEIDAKNMSVRDLAVVLLVRPFILGFREPIVFCWNAYLSLLYGILYCWIESFSVVFIEKHHFTLGENGLAFTALIVGSVIAYAGFLPWAIYVLKPRFKAGTFVPEDRLPIAMIGAIGLPISLFWFGWTSTASIHWISPALAASVWAASTYLLFQAGFNYLVDCYPRYVASVLAGNDLMRSSVGAAFPLFSQAFFHNLGVGPACSVLGGVALGMLPIPFILYRYGPKIRSWSKYAD